MRFTPFLAVLAGCAGVERPLPLDDFGTPHGELSLIDDLGDPNADLTMPRNHDLAMTGFDLGVVDLTADGCSLAKIRINEVQTGGNVSATDEFVELYNPCGAPVSLAGATLSYRSSAGTNDIAMDDLTGTVGATGFYLLASANYTLSATPDQPKGWKSASGLAANGGGVGLRDSGGTLIDSVGWGTATNAFVEGSAAVAPAPGHSIGRKPDGSDTNNNATDFMEFTTPTPRAPN